MALITISQTIGCGGTQVARGVAEELGLPLFDDDRLRQEALEMGVYPQEVGDFEESAPSWFQRLLTRKPEIYCDLLESVIYEVARGGQGVILGHGSQFLLQEFTCAFHTLIYAGTTARISRLVEQEGLSPGAAEKLIRTSDDRQRGFFRFAFHRNWREPDLYDLAITTEKISLDLAATLITTAVRSGEIDECSLNAKETIERLALTKRVEAALLKAGVNTSLLTIAVPAVGVVHLSGAVLRADAKRKVVEVASGCRGVKKVVDDLIAKPLAHA